MFKRRLLCSFCLVSASVNLYSSEAINLFDKSFLGFGEKEKKSSFSGVRLNFLSSKSLSATSSHSDDINTIDVGKLSAYIKKFAHLSKNDGILSLGQSSSLGITSVHLSQTYQGVPIWNSDVSILIDESGHLIRGYGEVLSGIGGDVGNISVIDKNTKQTTLKNFKQAYYGDKGRIFKNESVEQVIYVDSGGVAKNAIKVSFFTDFKEGDSDPEKVIAFIDAERGELIEQFDGLFYLNRRSNLLESTPKKSFNGRSNFNAQNDIVAVGGPSGNAKVSHPPYDPQSDYYHLKVHKQSGVCRFDAANVATRDYRSSTDVGIYFDPFEFNCDQTNINVERPVNDANSPLNDAHYRAQITNNMFEAYLGRKPYFGEKIIQNVHYGKNYDNAFYVDGEVYYGDGDFRFYPLVALDVVAHEIAHGYTGGHGSGRRKSMLYGQSRSINEAFSDMAGEAAEYYFNGLVNNEPKNDWVNNFESFTEEGVGLRNLRRPSADGESIEYLDDFYSGMNPYQAAGIFNKAFYTLANLDALGMGDTPWNTKYAFIVFAKANELCWNSKSNFEQAATCVMDSARYVVDALQKDGINGWSETELKNHIRKAFFNVGIRLSSNALIESQFSYTSDLLTRYFRDTSRVFGGIQSREWNFGDGHTSTEANPTHHFQQPGEYVVSLKVVSNSGNIDVITMPIVVSNSYCEASGTYSHEYFSDTVTFNGKGQKNSGGKAYNDFTHDPIVIQSGSQPTIEVITGKHPSSQNDEKNVYVWVDKNLDAKFDMEDELVFSESTRDSLSSALNFVGEKDKSYRVRVITSYLFSLKKPCGAISFAEIEDYTLQWSDNSVPSLFINVLKNENNNSIYFENNTTSNDVVSWEWDFGDGSDLVYLRSPRHYYQKSGEYSVLLKAFAEDSSTGGLVEYARWDERVIFASRTAPNFNSTINDRVLNVDADISVAPTASRFEWDFGDGAPVREGRQVEHTYAVEGDYTVTLTIFNDDNPNGVRLKKLVSIGRPKWAPAFKSEVDENLVVFKNDIDKKPSDKKGGTRWQFYWDFGDGGTQEKNVWGFNYDTEHTYEKSGNYTVRLTVTYTNNKNEQVSGTYEALVTVDVQSTEYCQAVGDTSYEYIASLTVNNTEIDSVNLGDGDVVNPNNPVVINKSGNNYIKIKAGYSEDEKYSEYYTVWIDYNGDGVFSEDDEAFTGFDKIAGTSESGKGEFVKDDFRVGYTGQLTDSVTRMRVMQLFSIQLPPNPIDPCIKYRPEFSESGEIEDYLVVFK